MEIWDVYNRYREKTGRKIRRGEPIAPGDYHLSIHACIFRSDGKMLIQQRHSFCKAFPDRWDLSAGGSALAGESSEQAAERELYEELGIRHDFSGLRPHMTLNYPDGLDDVFLLQLDINPQSLILQPKEVQAVRFSDSEEICRMIVEERFVPYDLSFIRLCFERRTRTL